MRQDETFALMLDQCGRFGQWHRCSRTALHSHLITSDHHFTAARVASMEKDGCRVGQARAASAGPPHLIFGRPAASIDTLSHPTSLSPTRGEQALDRPIGQIQAKNAL